jgi:hypothetical protein
MQLLCWDIISWTGWLIFLGALFCGKKSLGCSWGGLCSYYQAPLGLDVLPAHATRGKGGMASDWLCLGREGALDPAINIVASLCADHKGAKPALPPGTRPKTQGQGRHPIG